MGCVRGCKVSFGIEIVLTGRFRVTSADGTSLAPNSLKAQACIALLATSPNLERSRAWLCDRLWSDRGPEQARGSLRQVLTTIRQSLGDSENALQANRASVWLDPSMVTVVQNGRDEFLEGMDIADDEWNDWLRDKRAQLTQPRNPVPTSIMDPERPIQARREIPVVLTGTKTSKDDEVFIGGSLIEMLSRNLSETSGITASLDNVRHDALRLRLMSRTFENGAAIAASLSEAPAQRYLWATQVETDSTFPKIMADKKVYGLLFKALDAIGLAYLEKSVVEGIEGSPTGATLAAAHKILSYDLEKIGAACDLLHEICRTEAFPPAFGWLLFAIRANYYENAQNPKYCLEEIEEICERALQYGYSNAFVVSAVSAVYMRLLNRFDEGAALARRAFKLAPSNPFAIDSLASAFYMGDMIEKGYFLSRAAAMLSSETSFSSFFAMSQCVGATLYGRLDEAKTLAVSASAVSPRLRSAWRFRLALAANSGELSEAELCKRMLERYEQNFDVGRMVHDPDYPVQSIRASGIEMQRIDDVRNT